MDRRKVVIQYLQIVNMVSDGKKHIQRYTIKMGKPQKNRIFSFALPAQIQRIMTHTVKSYKAFGIINKKTQEQI